MTRRRSKSAIALVILFFFSTLFAQEPARTSDIVGEGVILAFQKGSRYRVRPYTSGIATFVEFWIVRVDRWTNRPDALADKRYILVEYNLYERGLTDCEINASKLRFMLRERRDDEHTNCAGSIDLKKDSTESVLSHYEFTTPGKIDRIPPVSSLPCFIADNAPVVIE